jgi:ribose transport system permease protein
MGAIIIGVLNNGLVLLNAAVLAAGGKGRCILLAVIIDKLGEKKRRIIF